MQQTKDWLCVDKPAGLSVHNEDAAMNLLQVLALSVSGPLHLVHRLDKPTSGLLLIARSSRQAAILQQVFADAQKTYQAVVRGVPKSQHGRWLQTLSPKAEGRRNPRGKAKQRVHAHTDYRVLASNPYLALLECTLQTGRQHQIRKHAVLNKHEVLGDSRYGDPRYQKNMQQRFGDIQLCLRATKLQFRLNGQDFHVEADSDPSWQRFAIE